MSVISSGIITDINNLVGFVTPAANIVDIRNLVGNISVDIITNVEQDVIFQSSTSGIICGVENTITSISSGTVVNILERVHSTNNIFPSFFDRMGWDYSIFIGDLEITQDMLHGDIKVSKASNTNTTVEFTILVSDPVAFIDDVYDGTKEVVIDYYDGTTGYRLATTLVDSPVINLLEHKVTLKCSNQRKELIEGSMAATVKSIGRYSEPVHGSFNSVNDELDLRLKTVPMDVDFDSYNNVNLNLWAAKATPDFIFEGNDIYRRAPTIDWQNRGDVVNTYVINLGYKHTRLYHYQLPYNWTAPYYGNVADYTANLYTSPSTDMINNAIDGTSWKKIGDASYTQVYPEVFGWFGVSYSSKVVTFTDSSGATITDAKGDTLYQNIPDAVRNDLHVMQASWSAAKRFSQYIQENYTITVRAPQSITKNGTVTDYQDVKYEDDYDAGDWEAFDKESGILPGATVSNNSYYLDIAELAPGTLNKALLTCIDMGKTAILNTHRGTLVTLQCKWLKPELELAHTIEIDAPTLRDWPALACKGKIVKIEHRLDTIDGDRQTEVTIALYRVPGSVSPTAITLPVRPVYAPSIPSSAISLGNHYGIIPVDGTGSDSWNGFIGNKATHFTTNIFGVEIPYTVRTEFTDIFRVDTPAIPDSLRAIQNLQATATYNILIPNDPLDIEL